MDRTEYMETKAYRTAAIMAERIARATGQDVDVEAVGGGMYAAVAVRGDGRVVAATDEGAAMYAGMVEWMDGSDAERYSDATDVSGIVSDAAAWIKAGAVVLAVSRDVAEFLHSLADIAADDPETWEDIHPNVDADDVRNAIDAAMRR